MSTAERGLPGALAVFLRGWVRDPIAVGAVAPSGRRLARLMTGAIRPEHRVVELGPGTGTVTREILARGVESRNLALIEVSRSFAGRLRQELPEATVVCGDAAAAHPELDRFVGKTDVVISGLPLMLFSRADRLRILRRSVDMLTESGCIYQFTYGGLSPVSRSLRDELGLDKRLVGITPANLPPAFVYRFSRRR